MNEYEKYSQEFQKLYLESNDEDDNSVDCYYEYMKPFLSKKQKVILLICWSLKCGHMVMSGLIIQTNFHDQELTRVITSGHLKTNLL